MIGKKLLHYEIIDKLGAGGMGEVYRARDTKLGRDVALKVLPEDMSRDPERRMRFEREARVIAALNHPNIVTIHSVEEVEERLFLTMELVTGKTLRDQITPDGMALEKFFSTALPLVDAVHSAHAQGITHRDLKPANVMISDEGRLKVLDFGLAKLYQEASDDEEARTMAGDPDTAEGHIMGTVSYMSPEQVEGKAIDGRSDIFSLGILFYEMLTGQRPFAGDSNASTISAILRDTPPPVSEIRQTLPNHLGRIIRRCLAKEPDRRYQTALDLRNDLRELAEEVDSGDVVVNGRSGAHEAAAGDTGGQGTATPGPGYEGAADPSGATGGPAPSGAQKTVPSDSIVLPGTRHTYRWVLAVVGVVLVAAVVIIALMNRPVHWPESAPTAVPTRASATVGVIGFENLSDPEDTENLGRVLMGLVTTGLAESGGLSVASTAKVLAARRQVGAGDREFDASLAAAAARDAGADVMLVGQVIRDGERMIITAELVDVASGNTLGSVKKQAASSSELFELAGAIAHDVRDLMGVSAGKGASSDFDLAQSVTDSPEAYRNYVSAQMALQQGQYAEAIKLFNRAIEIDPSFALAYLRNMMAHTWGGQTVEGLAMLKRGLPHIGRLPERWQIMFQAEIDFHEGRIDESYAALTGLIETSRDVPDAFNTLGEIATHHSKYVDVKRAREYFEPVLEIDPSYEVVFYHLVECYIAQRDFRALEDLIERYRRMNVIDPRVVGAELALWESQHRYKEIVARLAAGEMSGGDVTAWTQRARCLEKMGEWDRAFALCDSLVRAGKTGYHQAFALMQRASAQIGRGHIAAAMADYDEAAGLLAPIAGADGWAHSIIAIYRVVQVFVLTHAGDLDGALGAAQKAVAVDRDFTTGYLALLQAQLRSGLTAEAEATLRDIERVQAANQNPSDAFFVLMAEAVWEGHREYYDAALALLAEAERMPIETRHPWVQWWIEGETLVAKGDREGAIRAYEKILEPVSFLVHRQFISEAFKIPFYYELGRLEEDAGRLAEGRGYYEMYLERWGQADVVIPNVEDARERMKKLETQM